MQNITDIHARNSRTMEIIEELSAFDELEFDIDREELEREFAELRLIFNHN